MIHEKEDLAFLAQKVDKWGLPDTPFMFIFSRLRNCLKRKNLPAKGSLVSLD